MRSFPRLIASVLILGITAAPAIASTPWPAQLGRVSLAEAGASLRPAGGDWADAVVNEPIVEGMSIRSGTQGRAEIRLSGITVTLAPETTLAILRLDDRKVQLGLRTGHIDLSVGQGHSTQLEVDATKGPIPLDEPGRYGIDADNGIVGKLAAPDIAPLPSQVPATLPGAAALAGHGDWERSDIGWVWYPKDQAANWAPFRDGSWHYVQPWGWIWAAAAPWGFAPSHYGRWARIGDRWGWVPGSGDDLGRFVPASVAFLGTPGIGLSYAGGSGPAIAWFPLAPGEAYWPAVQGDPPAGLINAPYKNRRFATAVPRAIFVAGKPVADAAVDIPGRRLDVAPVMPGTPNLGPPTPKPAGALATIRPPKPAVPRLLAAAAPKPAPAKPTHDRIALDAPVRSHVRHVAAARHQHQARPLKMAGAPPHAEHDHRHLAEAHHILRQ
jgi:hypothetical protein